MTKTGKHLLILLTVLSLGILALVNVEAADSGKWVTRTNGYSYKKSGKYLRGLQVINDKSYYFDESGIQLTGWRKISGKYYHFQPKNGKNGYMDANTKVDGITLNAKGRAVSMSERSKKKIVVLIKAQNIVDRLTTPFMSKATKRRTLFNHVTDDYGNAVVPDYITNNKNLDIDYANFLFTNNYGDCYAYAAGFAYLMNAIGYDGIYFEHSGGHAWVHWDDYYYDPHFGKSYRSINCYHIPTSESSTGGRPSWPEIANFRKKIQK